MTTAPLALLLVDDDKETRDFVRCLLSANHILYETDCGGTALELTREHPLDCVLLNWRLPDIDAPTLIRIWTAARIPVIVLTAELSPQAVMQAMAQGAQDYLLKDQLSASLLEQTVADAKENASKFSETPCMHNTTPPVVPAALY